MAQKTWRRLSVYAITLLVLTGLSSVSAAVTQPSQPSPADGASASAAVGSRANDNATFVPPPVGNINCRLSADPKLQTIIIGLRNDGMKLINYIIHIENYTVNPLLQGSNWTYQGNRWSRASTKHGQALLALSFNYGILSLTTLTFGTHEQPVTLKDSPVGCLGQLSEYNKVLVVQDLLMHDFLKTDTLTLGINEYICHQIIENYYGYAHFTDRCCRRNIDTDEAICEIGIKNLWIRIFQISLMIMKMGLLLFGPLFMPTQMYTDEFESYQYLVKFKEYMRKTIYLSHEPSIKGMKAPKHILDLQRMPGFSRCKRKVEELPMNTPVNIKINEYDILVAYRKLLTENRVPVGLIRLFIRAFFQCKIREAGPFRDCCSSNLYGRYSEEQPVPWIRLWKLVGRFLMVFLIPLPFYIRLIFYYKWENEELLHRAAAIAKRGLMIPYENKLIFFFSPAHPLLVTIYLIYFITCFVLAFCTAKWWRRHFQRVAINAFRDLGNLSQLNAIGMVINNFIWPLKRFGLLGCLVGIVYWPIIMPITLVIFLVYCIPLVYLTIRMIAMSRKSLLMKKTRYEKEKAKSNAERRAGLLETTLLDKVKSVKSKTEDTAPLRKVKVRLSVGEMILHVIIGSMCVVSLLAVMIMFSECVGFLLEIAVFTLMGIIVNAGITLRYVTLILLVILYGHDCYSHAYQKYTKLNKAVFSDIKGRIKGLEEVTQLPSELQENTGFKSVEVSEQAEHEQPDDLTRDLDVTRQRLPLCWDVNDLILFVDKEDTPRIPRRLFDEACNIRVSGAPGPVYRSLIAATGRFMIIIVFLLFVFLVVMSFGEVYRVSSTNQTMATIAGGFLPFMLRYILKPKAPDIELGTVSFKSKLDEVIKAYRQSWPLNDLPFKIDTGVDTDDEGSDKESGDEEDDEKKDKDKDKENKDKTKNKDKDKKNSAKKDKGDKKKESDDKKKEKKDGKDSEGKSSRSSSVKDKNKGKGADDSAKNGRAGGAKEPNGTEVDILILVPEAQTRYSSWLPEWSDVESDDEEEKKEQNNDMRPLSTFNV